MNVLERPYGTFQRSFNLSVPVQADRVKADYKDGVLTITLPKEETKIWRFRWKTIAV